VFTSPFRQEGAGSSPGFGKGSICGSYTQNSRPRYDTSEVSGYRGCVKGGLCHTKTGRWYITIVCDDPLVAQFLCPFKNPYDVTIGIVWCLACLAMSATRPHSRAGDSRFQPMIP
jgi:hypothetical protein